MIKRIVIAGEGGQGIKFMSHILAKILSELGYEVSLEFDYDASVRGGKIVGFLTYSDKKIENPIIEEADILLMLSQIEEKFIAKKIVCEPGLCTEEQIPFSKIAIEKFGTPIVTDMVVLGRLLKLIGIDIEKVELKKLFPEKFIEENIAAVQYGYTYLDELH